MGVEGFLVSSAASTIQIIEEIFTLRKMTYMEKHCQKTITGFLKHLCFCT